MRGEPTIAELGVEALLDRLRGPGVRLDLGACSVRFRSDYRGLAEAMRSLYGPFPPESDAGFADVTLALRVRRTLIGRRLAQLIIDGESPFQILPIAMHLPLLEWGLNWTIAHRSHAWLMLHAGVVARGVALIAMVAIVLSMLEIPFALYRTFRIEARFGFNKMTWRLFAIERCGVACIRSSFKAHDEKPLGKSPSSKPSQERHLFSFFAVCSSDIIRMSFFCVPSSNAEGNALITTKT